MFEVRIHGRGGQGVVTAAEMLSVAAFVEHRWAQAFPSFGSERTGAPVVAFCRIDNVEIRTREPIAEPDALIVQDPSLFRQVDVLGGLKPEGYVIINSSRSVDELGLAELLNSHDAARVVVVAATELAMEHLGRPLPNAVLLGGFAAVTEVVSLHSVIEAIRQRFTGAAARGNEQAARAAYERVRSTGAIHA